MAAIMASITDMAGAVTVTVTDMGGAVTAARDTVVLGATVAVGIKARDKDSVQALTVQLA